MLSMTAALLLPALLLPAVLLPAEVTLDNELNMELGGVPGTSVSTLSEPTDKGALV